MKKLIPITPGMAVALAFALIPTGGVAAQGLPSAFPAGPGHDQVAAACAACHPATQVTQQRMSEDDWSTLLDRMIGMGAKVSEDERPVILKYLNDNFGTDADAAKTNALPAKKAIQGK